MILLAHITIEGFEHLQGELVRQGRHIRNLTARVKKLGLVVGHMKTHIADNTNSIRFLSSMLGILLSDLNKYLML